MLTKSKQNKNSITFTQLKQLRKTYPSLINHDPILTELNNSLGVTGVLNHLEKRYKRHTVTFNDLDALHYIINNFDHLQYNLTWY